MTDILEQLRMRDNWDEIYDDAATEIERLREANALLFGSLHTAITYGLPPHDASGVEKWQGVLKVLAAEQRNREKL